MRDVGVEEPGGEVLEKPPGYEVVQGFGTTDAGERQRQGRKWCWAPGAVAPERPHGHTCGLGQRTQMTRVAQASREGGICGHRCPVSTAPPSEYHWSDLTGTQRPREPVTRSVRLQSRAWRVDLEGQRPCPVWGCEGRGPCDGPQCLDVTQALSWWQHAQVCWVQWPEVLGPPAERQTGRRSS